MTQYQTIAVIALPIGCQKSGEYFCVAADESGVYTFDEQPYPNCLYKTSKSGKKTWQQNVLEAKLVCSNGFSLSIATEWIKKEDGHLK